MTGAEPFPQPSFDSRITALEAFTPHGFDHLIASRALPEGALDAAVYAQIITRFRRLDDAEVARLTYRVAGLEVTGVMLTPTQIQPGSHPLLIYNRGGSGEYGKLSLPIIMRYLLPFARQGYLVFASNYRGNDGGTGSDEFGGAELKDILELLDIAAHHPAWDGRNRFMFGGSRGGMMTYLAIRHGAALNAAASFAAPADFTALAAEVPDIERGTAARRIPGFPGNRAEAYAERSALCWPEMLRRVPLLLLHGDADTRIPVSHTLRLGDALEARNAPAKTVIYRGGNHSLSTHMPFLLEEVMGWFQHYRI